MTSEQLKDALGFTRSYVNHKICEGMPPDSVEATPRENPADLTIGRYESI